MLCRHTPYQTTPIYGEWTAKILSRDSFPAVALVQLTKRKRFD